MSIETISAPQRDIAFQQRPAHEPVSGQSVTTHPDASPAAVPAYRQTLPRPIKTLGPSASLDLIWAVAAVAIVGLVLLAVAYNAAPNPSLAANEAIPSLLFFTLGAGLVVVLAQFAFFLRSRRNRAATERVLTK